MLVLREHAEKYLRWTRATAGQALATASAILKSPAPFTIGDLSAWAPRLVSLLRRAAKLAAQAKWELAAARKELSATRAALMELQAGRAEDQAPAREARAEARAAESRAETAEARLCHLESVLPELQRLRSALDSEKAKNARLVTPLETAAATIDALRAEVSALLGHGNALSLQIGALQTSREQMAQALGKAAGDHPRGVIRRAAKRALGTQIPQ